MGDAFCLSQRAERLSYFFGKQSRLFECGEMSAAIEFVEVDGDS